MFQFTKMGSGIGFPENPTVSCGGCQCVQWGPQDETYHDSTWGTTLSSDAGGQDQPYVNGGSVE